MSWLLRFGYSTCSNVGVRSCYEPVFFSWKLKIIDNIIAEKSFAFAIRIVNLYKYLHTQKREFIMAKQLLRCGTSIGANIAESQNAQSTADFLSKLNIAFKEATETKYWLRLLHSTEYLSNEQFDSIYSDIVEIEKILVAIVKSIKE